LKHVERTRVLLHLVTLDPEPEREPVRDFEVLMDELRRFAPELAARPMVVAVSKLDLPDVREALDEVRGGLAEKGVEDVLAFSAATGEGVEAVLDALERVLAEHPERPAPRAEPLSGAPSEDEDEDEGELEIEYV
jgi:GTP-binding protein